MAVLFTSVLVLLSDFLSDVLQYHSFVLMDKPERNGLLYVPRLVLRILFLLSSGCPEKGTKPNSSKLCLVGGWDKTGVN